MRREQPLTDRGWTWQSTFQPHTFNIFLPRLYNWIPWGLHEFSFAVPWQKNSRSSWQSFRCPCLICFLPVKSLWHYLLIDVLCSMISGLKAEDSRWVPWDCREKGHYRSEPSNSLWVTKESHTLFTLTAFRSWKDTIAMVFLTSTKTSSGWLTLLLCSCSYRD